jgi:cold shock CspA family protein
MRDPVVAADGLSYERRFIEKWLRDGNRSSPVTREPLRFPHLYPNQHLRTLIQRRPHGGSSIAALHIADPHFKQMDPNERRTAEVEWFVAKPNRGGYGVAKSDVDGKVFFAESTVRDEPGGYGVPVFVQRLEFFPVALRRVDGVEAVAEISTRRACGQKITPRRRICRRSTPHRPTRVPFAAQNNAAVTTQASGRKISYKVDPNDQTVQVEGVDHTKGIDVEVLAVRKPPSPRNRPPLNSRERIRGTCTWFSDQCKYGYLRPDDTSKPDVFVHAAALTDLGNTLRSGDRCEFRVATYNGRQRAVNVVGVDGFTGYDYDEYTGDLIRRGGDGRDVPAFAVPPVPQTAPARYGAEPFFARPAGLPAARAAPPSFDLPPLGAPTPRAAEWPGSAPPPGMAPGVPRVTPRNYPLFNSEDSATGDSSQSRGGGGSIDWRP